MGAQSCLTLYDPVDWGLPGSSVHGISQGRVFQWATVSFFRRSSRHRGLRASLASPELDVPPGFLPLAPPGKPPVILTC